MAQAFSGQGLQVLGQISSAVTTGLGQMRQADAQAAAAESRARAYEYNAAIAEQNVQLATSQAAESRRRQERISKARLASKSTGFLKSGVALSGSPLAVLGEEALQEALAAEDITYEGQLRAASAQNQANTQRFYADQTRQQSSYRQSESNFKLGTSLLGSATRIFR